MVVDFLATSYDLKGKKNRIFKKTEDWEIVEYGLTGSTSSTSPVKDEPSQYRTLTLFQL